MQRKFDELVEILRQSPTASRRLSVGRSSVRIRTSSQHGFDVFARKCGGIYTVGFAGWRCHTQRQAAAVDMVLMAFSPACRLRIDSRDGIDYCWTVEVEVEMQQWEPGHTTRKWFYPYWGEHAVRYLSNEPIIELPTWVPTLRRSAAA